jgi:hypothetical protein
LSRPTDLQKEYSRTLTVQIARWPKTLRILLALSSERMLPTLSTLSILPALPILKMLPALSIPRILLVLPMLKMLPVLAELRILR